jgi:hypothetical protein
MSTKSQPIVLDVNTWVPDSIRFTLPKVNDKQGKSINIISNQTGRGLHISSPLMTTWGISDFVDQTTGVSDGKFSISLSFPNQEYATKNSTMFLDKVKAFETAILNEAVNNSEVWWGEKLTLDILKYSFFPILKFPKIKGTKKPDMTKSPTLSAKVPFYEKDNRWNVELYDTNGSLIFPCDNEEMTPAHFVPKLSNVACVLQCGGIWIGGKGWGVTWKLVQAVVKPKEVVTVFGKCHIKLSEDEKNTIENEDFETENEINSIPALAAPASTMVDDSDNEEEAKKPAAKLVTQVVVEEKPVVVDTPVVAATAPEKKVIKKVVKKA